VRIGDGPKAREQAWYEAPVIEFILRRYLAALGGRQVLVWVEPSSELFSGPIKALAWISPGSVEIEIALKGGETLIITAGGALSLNMMGFPPGFWAGVLGFGVAVITVLMVRREARPLRQLAAAVDRMNLPGKFDAIADSPRSAPEIRALIAAFNRLSGRFGSLLEARMALIGGISHDLRTYATRLRLRAEPIPDTGWSPNLRLHRMVVKASRSRQMTYYLNADMRERPTCVPRASPSRGAGGCLQHTPPCACCGLPDLPLSRQRVESDRVGIGTHDLRPTPATSLDDMGVPDEVIERVMNKVLRTVAGRHCDHAKHFEPMRKALDAWAEQLKATIEERLMPPNVALLRAEW